MGFSTKDFRDPPAEFYPGYFWVLDSPITEENLLEMLHDMKEHKALSICIHPCPQGWATVTEVQVPYMSEEYLRLMGKVYAEADRLGMHIYLYDEGGFPSGTALGEVLLSDPERFAVQYMLPDGKSGKFRLHKDPPGTTPGSVYPNLLEKGVGERFIQFSHEKHKSVAENCLGKSMLYTFTDEPVFPGGLSGTGGMNIGWCSDFSEEFFKRKNYRIEPFFRDLIRKPSRKESEEVRKHRIDYCDVRARLFEERYLIPLRDWARKNNLGSGGHFGGDDCPEANFMCCFGHIMRSLRTMDLPGVDIIWRQIHPRTKQFRKKVTIFRRKLDPVTNAPRNAPFTKYASSIARQSGKNRVLSEDFAAYGAGLTPQVMKYVIDHQLLRGATNFVFSNIPHGCYGKLLSAGCRPKFGTSHPFWDWFDTLHTYTAGMAAMLSLGTPEVNTLLYFDVPSIWCGASIMDKAVKEHFRSAEELLKRHVDFDFADDDALAGGKIVNGRFQVGVLSYDTLVIPAENRMFPEAARMVESFRQQGGRVLTTGELDQIAPVMGIRSKSNALRAVKRRSGKETLYFITNESDRDVKAELTFGEAGLVQFLDGWNVKRYALPCENQTLSWNFEPFGSALFIINSEAEPDAPYPFFRGGKKKLLLKENWTIQPVRKCVYTTDDTYEIRTLDEQPRPVQLGDWRKVLGEYFSGEALYRTEFDSPSDQKAKLSLGEICYVAQVTLNGKDLGKTFSGKAEFFTEGILKKGKNILEVRVVNTPANAISDPELKAHWKANHPPSLFQEMQYIFESESLESGLLGPVTLHFAAKSE